MSDSPGIADELSASSRYQDLGRGPACAISQLSVAYYLRPERPHPLVEWRIGDLPFVLACKEAPSLSRLGILYFGRHKIESPGPSTLDLSAGRKKILSPP